MDWVTVFKIIAAAVVSAGGAGAIIVGVAKGIARRIADGIAEKIRANNQLELDKMLEEYKTRLDNSGYISKRYYDIEATTFQDLCSAFFSMISGVHWLFPSGLDRAPAMGNLNEICNERYKTAQSAYNTAAAMLGSKAPFISNEMYTRFQELLSLAAQQIHAYAFANPEVVQRSIQAGEIAQEGYARTEEIDKLWHALLDKLRGYLQTLKGENGDR